MQHACIPAGYSTLQSKCANSIISSLNFSSAFSKNEVLRIAHLELNKKAWHALTIVKIYSNMPIL